MPGSGSSKPLADKAATDDVTTPQVKLPKDAILNKFADIENDQYKQVGEERMRLEVIGQRLLTGRLCIAEAALVSARVLHQRTETYAKQKVCNGIDGEVKLAELPQIAATIEEGYAELDRMLGVCAGVEERLAACLVADTIPNPELVEAIAVCKIRAIAVATERAHLLRQEVGYVLILTLSLKSRMECYCKHDGMLLQGCFDPLCCLRIPRVKFFALALTPNLLTPSPYRSYALMDGTGFEKIDMLLCCKFAEGDSRILQQKLARDRLKELQRGGVGNILKGLVSVSVYFGVAGMPSVFVDAIYSVNR
jgi:acyl-CoA oxidase